MAGSPMPQPQWRAGRKGSRIMTAPREHLGPAALYWRIPCCGGDVYLGFIAFLDGSGLTMPIDWGRVAEGTHVSARFSVGLFFCFRRSFLNAAVC